MAAEFKCEFCNSDHDYKTEYNLMKRRKTALHKQKSDLDFAAAEQAAKQASIDKGHAELPFIGRGRHRYHGSTTSAMLLYQDGDKIKSNI